MVTNYTADQIGDIFYSTMIDPYLDVQQILGWDIVVGISTPATSGKFNFTENLGVGKRRMQIFRISDFILVFAMACCGPVRVCPCA